eukprot:GGOE01000753.1.p1 GENE.GGOE01000753.1~~GGOE01000753.1.p1  ORF type:complete len:869 (+),score=296.90 GGOE01000753.1:70-2676(+)
MVSQTQQTTFQQVAQTNGRVAEAAVPPTVRIIYQITTEGSTHPYDYAVNFNQGIDHFHRQEYEAALQCFSAADRAEPGQTQCVAMLAVCYDHLKRPIVAMGVYSYALQLDPHYALAWHNKGVLHAERNELHEAKQCYLNAMRDRVLTGTPDLRTVASNLGGILFKLGEKEAAARTLEEVMIRHPDDHMTAAWLADIHTSIGNHERAYQLLMQLPNSGKLKEGAMLLAKSKMNDVLVNLAQPNAFRLPKATRLQEAYETAVEQTVTRLRAKSPDAALKVVDCDSIGWLALKALQSGCQRACCLVKSWNPLGDAIVETAVRNGFPPPVLQVKFYPPEVPEGLGQEANDASLIINAIYSPSQVPGVMNRVKLYRDRGLATVPRSGTVRMMGISSQQIRTQCNVQSQVNGFDLTAFGDFCRAIRKYVMQMHLSTIPHDVLTEVISLDIGNEVDTDAFFGKVIDLPVVQSGKLDAVVSWYDLDLAEGVALSMGPDEDCAWQQNVQVVQLGGTGNVEAGDTLHLRMTVTRWSSERSHQWIMFEELTHEAGGEVKQKHETFLSTEDPLEGRLWHFDMMADIGRNNAYQRALEALVKPDHIVLDIGTGSGLLSMMAARAGAKHVYAIEGNESIAEKARNVIRCNGYSDRITVITGMSNDVMVGEGSPLPVKADIVVTETMGADFLSELMYNILDDARKRLLKPGALMIPGSGRVLGQLLQIDSPWHLAGFPPTEGLASGGKLDLSAFNRLLPPMRSCLQICKVKHTPISEVFTLFSFDFQKPLCPAGNVAQLDVPITRPGTLHAIAFWWDADLGVDESGPIIIETGPASRYAYTDHAHWSQQLQLLDFTGRPMALGEMVPLQLYNDNHLTFVELRG